MPQSHITYTDRDNTSTIVSVAQLKQVLILAGMAQSNLWFEE